MITFQLYKPLYEWRQLPKNPDGSSNGSDLFLADNVKKWLDTRNIKYSSYSETKACNLYKGDGIRTYIFYYLDIEDDRDAMLFKLTWM